MERFIIRNHINGSSLFSGQYKCFKDCLEDAHINRVSLRYADLRNQNLSNLQLDEADLSHALFAGSNLAGANLSDGSFTGSDFSSCDLYNACFAYSDLTGCNFEYAGFGATDIAGCNISRSRFAALSCFSLNFTQVENMNACIYKSGDGAKAIMSKPPVVISGLSVSPVVILDDMAYCGDQRIHENSFVGLLNIRAAAKS